VNAAASKLAAGPPPQTVYAAIAAWARRASADRLAAWAIGGCSAAALVAVFVSVRWVAALPLIAGAVGVWGLADRRLRLLEALPQPPSREARAFRVLQTLALIAGTLAGIISFYGVLLFVLGPRWNL